MTDPTKPVLPVSIRYGVIGVLLSAVYSIILYFIGQQYNLWLGFVGLLFPVLVISFGIRAYKHENGNLLAFGQGMAVGMLIALIYSIGAFLFTELYTNYIVDNYWEGMADRMESMFERFGMSDEQIEQQLDKLAKRQRLGNKVASTFGSMAFLGVIVSAIATAILKTPARKEMQ